MYKNKGRIKLYRTIMHYIDLKLNILHDSDIAHVYSQTKTTSTTVLFPDKRVQQVGAMYVLLTFQQIQYASPIIQQTSLLLSNYV